MADPNARVEQDADGVLWFVHVCTGSPLVRKSRLTNGTWKVDTEGNVTPSVNCLSCGTHAFYKVTVLPHG